MIRERHYEDAELARRLKDWLIDNHFKNIDIKCRQEGSRVFFEYREIEYHAKFYTEGNIRKFSFHVENPKNSLVQTLNNELKNDRAYYEHEVLSRPKFRNNLHNYKDIFKREQIGQGTLEIGKKEQKREIPTAFVTNKIKKIPLGRAGHLSEKFIVWLYDYNMRPIMLFC